MAFDRVLINDDHDAILDNVTHILSKLNIENINTSQYCDEAYLKLMRAKLDGRKYDLIITDLSFSRDHRNIKLDSGEELIEKIREEFPSLKIIVYTMKDQIAKVNILKEQYNINGYIFKDRRGAAELKRAVKVVAQGNDYFPQQVIEAIRNKSNLEIDTLDIKLIKLLSKGLSQEEISDRLKAEGIKPNSLSTIEKRLNKLRLQLRAKNAIHLVALSKDIGII